MTKMTTKTATTGPAIASGRAAQRRMIMALAAALGAFGPSAALAHGPDSASPAMKPGRAAIFALADADKDGALSKAEYETFAVARIMKADADKDGVLSESEARTLAAEMMKRRGGSGQHAGKHGDDRMQARMEKRMERRAGRMFERFDADNDGRVTTAEVTTLVLARFARMDDNNDGSITPDEMGGRFGRDI
ncbi:MAG: hypothetical protein MUC58_12510 [Rhizobiaceae bacterium]|nr:hypothetical protein [Rhizobiaceae bacterium]